MPITWNLRKWLALHRDIYRPADLQALLKDKAGVILSHQAVAALMQGTPSALRLQTMQALCNALDCQLSDFCEVTPDAPAARTRRRKVANASPTSPQPPRRLYGAERSARPADAPEPGRTMIDAQRNPFPTPYTFYPSTEQPPSDGTPASSAHPTSKRRPPPRYKPPSSE